MRFALPILVLILSGLPLYCADQITIHGYVVEVNSPTNLTVDDFSVTNPNKLNLEFGGPIGNGRATLPPGQIRVGTEVEITGEYNAATHQMTVKTVKAVPDTSSASVKGTAVLDKLPELEKTPQGWSGYIFTDGQKVQVTDSSAVTLAAGNTPVATLAGIDLDTFVHYEGNRQPDGSIRASRVAFEPLRTDPNEFKLLKKLAPKLEDPAPGTAGSTKLQVGRKSFRLVSDQSAQDYVGRIGRSLIPEHQRDLAKDNPFRIPFQFYLVDSKSTDIIAYPNGVIIVPSGVFNYLENEAQLAFWLSDAITQLLERGIWRLLENDRALRGGLAVAIIAADLTLPLAAIPLQGLSATMTESTVEDLTEQADRVGMEGMLAAGYDIREAPRAWKSMALKQPPLNPAVKEYPEEANRADLDAELAKHRDLLMAQLRENYARIDYSTLKKDSDEFHAVAQQALGVAKKKQK